MPRQDDTAPCPHCGRDVYDDAERCPYCENYLSEEDDAAPRRRPWWVLVCALLCLYAVYRWIAG